ncbi:MAG: hypothetical protein N2Z21_00600, partial [Candidatus Sumerlaeaceae bacterium]|nr:hypothetical protein [Candidatus Sumerlaeaceae bacterium]
MKTPKVTVLISLCFVILHFIHSVPNAWADRLIFKTGSSADGVILEENAERVVFRSRSGEVATYSKDLLQSVVREETTLGVTATDIIQKVTALREARRLNEALDTILQAVSQSPQLAPAFTETFLALLYQLDGAIKEAASTTDTIRTRQLLKTRFR